MSDDNSSLIDLSKLPSSIDNAVTNLTNKPTQAIGQTLSDVWYLVFGGLSQAAEKRRMKYAHNLALYSQELSQSISNIPSENLIEPDIQVTAQALENSKYCIESEELRKMFINLISNSMNRSYIQKVHPAFAEVIKQMSPIDARIFKSVCSLKGIPLVDYILEDKRANKYSVQFSTVYLSPFPDISIETASSSISSLSRLGLIEIDYQAQLSPSGIYQPYKETDFYKQFSQKALSAFSSKRASTREYSGLITPFGQNFFEVCVK